MDQFETMKGYILGQVVRIYHTIDGTPRYVKVLDVNPAGMLFKVLKIGSHDEAGYENMHTQVGRVEFRNWNGMNFCLEPNFYE
jgi:hypothetical protein